MQTILIWGTGKVAEDIISKFNILEKYNICGFVDNNSQKWNQIFYGYKVYAPEKETLMNLGYDLIVVLSNYYDEIKEQINTIIPLHKLIVENQFYFYKEKLINRYKDSKDPDVKKILAHMEEHPLSVFNSEFEDNYIDKDWLVEFDSDYGMYYADYYGKRMYLAKRFDTEKKVKDYLRSITVEQDIESPHCYCDESFKPCQGDVIVDAGVAEGNFSLEYIDVASKIYMIEPDEEWIEALKATFKDYSEKVVIVSRKLGAFDDVDEAVRLDSVIPEYEEINFIKMDIEGSEWDALRGALCTIRKSENLKLAICSYHSDWDQELIETYFDKEGISHTTTLGYMWFPYSIRETSVSMELHRGIVRGIK